MIPLEQFWASLVIERVDGTIGTFGESAAPFQWRFLHAVEPALAWIASAGGNAPPPERWWYWGQRHRGSSKSTDCVIALLPPFLTCPLARRFIILSTDSDAARVLIQIASKIVKLNPALASRVRVDRWKLTNTQTGSEIAVMSNDAASFYGQLPDVIVADELTHWADTSGEALWDSLISTMPKKKHLVLIILSNAGWLDSWQRRVFDAMQDVPHAMVDVMHEKAHWVTEQQLAAQRRLVPASTYRRLWENEWVPGTGDALDPADVEAACTLSGPVMKCEWGVQQRAIVCLDVGVRHDRSAMVVLVLDFRAHRIKLGWVQDWAPPYPGGSVDLEAVFEAVARTVKTYRATHLCYDEWQAMSLAQRIQRLGVNLNPVHFAGDGATRMANSLLEVFRERRIDLFRHPQLLRDLQQLSIVERPTGGYKVSAPRNKEGHADLGISLTLGLPLAWQALREVTIAPSPPIRFHRVIT